MAVYRYVELLSTTLSKKVATALVDTPMLFTHSVKPNFSMSDITISGDGQELHDTMLKSVTFTVTAAGWDDPVLALLYKPAVTASPPTGVVSAQGFGSVSDGTSLLQLTSIYAVKDINGSTVAKKKLIVPQVKVIWTAPFDELVNILSGDAKGQVAQLSAQRGNLDLLGATVFGMATDDFFVIHTLV